MMSCKKTSRLMSRQLDCKLPLLEAMAVRVHRLLCSDCDNFGDNLALLRKACQRAGGDGGGANNLCGESIVGSDGLPRR